MLKFFVGFLTAVCFTTYAEETVIPIASMVETGHLDPFTGKVTGNKVRLRTQPSLDGHVVKETECGTMFIVTGEKEGFYVIAPPQGTKGYVFRTFVLDGVIEGEHVNIRLFPDTEAPVVGQLNRGERVTAKVSEANNKWLEIDLPATSHFYVAKEFIERLGPVTLFAQLQTRQHEATHKFNAACLYAQSEIQKPLPQIDLESISSRLTAFSSTYKDLPAIAASAEEANRLIQEVYVQKKIAFLETKGDVPSTYTPQPALTERLAQLGIRLKNTPSVSQDTLALASSSAEITDKMLIWEPLEKSMHQLWAATRGEHSFEEFYAEEGTKAITLTGMIEPYNRPVQNLPGDYLLRIDNHPAAFLYSTRVNLQHLVGKQVTIVGSPRPNNHFAFPAYFVLSVE